MFYAADTRDHGMRYDPFKAIVSPRPIGWVGSYGVNGTRNLSPFSFFNAISDNPKLVMFAAGSGKDSPRNAVETREFTTSFVSRNLARQMNESSVAVPYGVDEFEIAGLKAEQGRLVRAPYVSGAYAVLECKVTEVIHPVDLDGADAGVTMVIGQVVGIHIDEAIIRDGRLDMSIAKPVGRMGYMDYSEASEVFEMVRPPRP
jgi:flavin reductase (DIM6/NTAB) family NADH-FMN oxidoreductase RutF